MKQLYVAAAIAALSGAAFAETKTVETVPATDANVVAVVETPAAVDAPALTAENPGLTTSWLMDRHIYTTNQPSTTAWSDVTVTERPAEWNDIAKINDVVLDKDGNLIGYLADIGGFLGMGAKTVLLGKDALHLVRFGDDSVYATNFTKEELESLPEFDSNVVMK